MGRLAGFKYREVARRLRSFGWKESLRLPEVVFEYEAGYDSFSCQPSTPRQTCYAIQISSNRPNRSDDLWGLSTTLSLSQFV